MLIKCTGRSDFWFSRIDACPSQKAGNPADINIETIGVESLRRYVIPVFMDIICIYFLLYRD